MSDSERFPEKRDSLPPLLVEVVKYPLDVADAVIRVAFCGTTSIGPERNQHGQQMRAAILEAVKINNAQRVIVDLRSLDYQFGDWIWTACRKAAP